MLFKNVLIGADPELFLQNPNSGGFVSAHKYVKGSKKKPFLVDRGAVQVDGTAAEFNILPAATAEEFIGNIQSVINQLREMTRPSGYTLVAEPVADFDPVYFDNEVPMFAKMLGCDPDYNAWFMVPNDAPNGERAFRTGAGHIHIGWTRGADINDPDHFMLAAEVSRQLDYYLGTYSLMWDKDNRRRELYGKAGAFRPKPYGMEYRVLSNAWLKSELLMRWVYFAARKALEDLDEGLRAEDFYANAAQEIIDNNMTDWMLNMPDPPVIESIPLPPRLAA